WRTVGRGRVTLAGSFGRFGVGLRTRTDPMTPAKSSAGGRAGRLIRGAPEAVDRLPAGRAAPDFGSRLTLREPHGTSARRMTLPSAARPKPGLCAISQACPSRSRKTPAYPP